MEWVTRLSKTDFALLAERFPDAVATWRDLVKLGVGEAVPSRRCRPGGGWTRLLTGTYLLTGGAPSRRQLVRAALLRAGPLAVVTGVEGARRHGVRRLPDELRVHVLVPGGQHVSSQSFLLVERTERPWRQSMVDGFPIAQPARCLVDAARREQRIDTVRAMIADAVQRDACCVQSLATELRHLRLRGTAVPRSVLDEVNAGVRSAAEAWARRLVRRTSLPEPEWNVELRSATGHRLAIVDAWWEDVGLAWEIDSKEFHLAPSDYERTMTRHSALAAAGVMVVHTLPSQLKKDPSGVVRDLVAAHEWANRSPHPAVTTALYRPTA
ncbi:hypothetical protein [Kutzneria chonburiensis]|nr:hypothetical protein [Kutzneria chonburiensis]